MSLRPNLGRSAAWFTMLVVTGILLLAILTRLTPILTGLQRNAGMLSANGMLANYYGPYAWYVGETGAIQLDNATQDRRSFQPIVGRDHRTQALLLAIDGQQTPAATLLAAGDTLGRDLIFIGDSLARGRQFSESLWWYQQAAALPESAAEAWHRQGDAAAAMDQLEDARGYYERAQLLEPALYTKSLVETLELLDEQETIITVLEASLAQMPEHDERAWWWQQLGLALEELERWNEAHGAYEAGISEFPENLLLRLALSRTTYEAGGGFAAAWDELQIALAQEPERAGSYFAAGQLLAREERWAEADEWFAGALARESDNISWLLTRATTARNAGDLNHAVALYEDLLDRDPQSPTVHYEAAWAYRLAGSPEQAIEHIERAIRLTNGNRAAYYVRAGKIYEWLNDNQQARLAYETALEITPNNRSALSGLARIEEATP